MKKLILLVSTVLSISLLTGFSSDKYQTQEEVSTQIIWTGSKVIGSLHTGTIKLKENNLIFEEGELKGGNVVVDMNTIINTDLDGKWNTKIVEKLKSINFFYVEKYPTSELTIKSITDGKYRNEYLVKADLKIKDIQKEIEFDLKKSEEGNLIVFRTVLTIDRTEFDIKYQSGSFFDNIGDEAIKDDFSLNIRVDLPK